LVHSARWNEKLDLTGKNVAVIGSGASGIQIVPTIQPGMFSDPERQTIDHSF
jgi:cation diffusion facilitator CzcD-associated flavoprotein CzcO